MAHAFVFADESRQVVARAVGGEEAFFFENEGKKLFGVLHIPREPGRRQGIIFCDPYGEEKQIVHRIFVTFARKLCNEGFYVLRFDYRGYGDSEGEFEDAVPMSQLSDIDRAVNLMVEERGITRLGLLGVRLGGTLAALAAATEPRIEFLILCAPILRPKEYFGGLIRREFLSGLTSKGRRNTREYLMARLDAEGLIGIDGHYLSKREYSEFSAVDLGGLSWRFKGDIFIAAITRDPQKLDRDTECLSATCRGWGDGCEFKILQEETFWDPITFDRWTFPHTLYREMLAWLRGQKR